MAKKKVEIGVNYKVTGAGKAEDSFEGIGNEANKAGNQVENLNKKTKETSGLIKNLKNIGGALGITAGVATLGMAFKDAFNNIRQFSKSNSDLAAVLGKTKDDIKELTDLQKELGATTEFSASQVANAQIELAKMGFTMTEIGSSTAGVLSLASASGATLTESAEVMSATLRGFGLDASESGKVADTMAASFVNSSLDMEKFRESMKLVAPIARAANIDLDTTTALLGELATNGLAGSIAGTGLKNLMSKLSNENSKLSKELGFSVKNSDDLVRAFQELKKGNIDLTQATELTDERSKAAFLTMINGIDNVEALKVKLGEVGTAALIAAEKMNNLDGDIKILGSAWEGLTLQGSEAESGIRSVVQGITKAINFLAENFRTIMKVVASVTLGFIGYKTGIVAARIATIAYSATQGTATVATALFSKGLKGARTAFKGLNATMRANPFGLIITLLGTLLPFLIDLGDESDKAAGKVDKLTEAQKRQAEVLANNSELKKRYDVRDKLSKEALQKLKQDLESQLSLEEDNRAKNIANTVRDNKLLNENILFLEKEIAGKLEGLEIRKNLLKGKAKEDDIKENQETIKQFEIRIKQYESELVNLDDLNGAVGERKDQIVEVNKLLNQGNPIRTKEIGLLQQKRDEIKALKELQEASTNEKEIINIQKNIDAVKAELKALTDLSVEKTKVKKDALTQEEIDTLSSIERTKDFREEDYLQQIEDKRKLEDAKHAIAKQAAIDEVTLSKATAEQKGIEIAAIEELFNNKEKQTQEQRDEEDKEATLQKNVDAFDAAIQIADELSSAIFDQQKQALDLKQSALDESFKNGEISEEQYNKQKQKLSDEAFQIEKKAALAKVAIDTASAISSLVAAAAGNPLNLLTGGAAGVAQFASGIIAITANMASAAKLLSSSPPSIGQSATGPAPSTDQTEPNISFDGQSAGTERFGTNIPIIQAYVTQSDITNAQNTASNIESLSSIG